MMNLIKEKRIHSYDFLRGLAIIAVIATHVVQSFPSGINLIDTAFQFGRYGVQLFYFVSALTMCHMWKLREGEDSPIKKFYIRRVLRIAPLFWLAIPVYLLINGLKPTYFAPNGISLHQVLLTITFLHGFWPDSINSVVPGGWSIAVEMTFYLLFPVLILTIKGRSHIYLALAFAIYFLYTFFLRDFLVYYLTQIYQTNNPELIHDFLFLNFINQVPIFLIGCCLFFLSNNQLKNYSLFFLLWLFVSWAGKFYFKEEGFGFVLMYILIAISTFLIVKFNCSFFILEKLGKYSYSIYLFHFLILKVLQKVLQDLTGLYALLTSFFLAIIFSYIIALLSYELIEKRIHYYALKITKN